MYEVLAYLFEHCQQADLAQNSEIVVKKLSAAGFEDADISEALTWMAGVMHATHHSLAPLPDARRAFRAYAPKELAKLDAQCRGFLLALEQADILNPQTREHVIERALAAVGDSLCIEQLKLIVLMVLWNLGTPTSRLVAEDLFSAPVERLPS